MEEITVFEAWKSGQPVTLEWCINRGIIRTSVITYCNIFDTYKRVREQEGLGYMQGVIRTAELMNTSPETVKRAIAEMA